MNVGVVTSQKVDAQLVLIAADESRTVRHEQALQQSMEWTREAQEARHAKNLDRALELFTWAAVLDPTNLAAAHGRDEVLKLQGRDPRALGAIGMGDHPHSTQIPYQVEANLGQGKAAIQQKQWQAAEAAFKRARLAAESDPSLFTPEDMQNFRNRIDQAELDLRIARERAGSNKE